MEAIIPDNSKGYAAANSGHNNARGEFDTRHLILQDGGRLVEILPSLLEFSTERVSELLQLGSIYLNKKRVLEDFVVAPLSYVRVHCKPKRYDVSKTDWKSRLIFENDHMVIVNKPKGFPVPSAVDNVQETVIAQFQKALDQKLFITQRLDVLTSGILVFAKTLDFQKSFNALLAEGSLYKEYLGRTSDSPSLGHHIHYLKPSMGSPKEVFLSPESSDWKECRLNVLETQKLGEYSSTRIHLLTGRTHQIRAQMTALGCALWGDKLYGAPGPENEYSLISKVLRFRCPITKKQHDFSI